MQTVILPIGIEPLDERTGGLPGTGLYVLSSPPTDPRSAAVFQFLGTGLSEGERVALVTRRPPERVVETAERIGLPFREAWEEDRLRLVGFRGEHESRIRRAGDPGEVFEELAEAVPENTTRLALDPGTPLWEGRTDGAAASAFVRFVERAGTAALATTTAELEGDLSPGLEVVAHAAKGLFRMRTTSRGLVRLRILRLEPRTPDRPEITMVLEEEGGLAAPDEMPERRGPARTGDEEIRTLRVSLGGDLPAEVDAWIEERCDVTAVEDPMEMVARLQGETSWDVVLVVLDRGRQPEGRRACHVSRRLRSDLPVMVISRQQFRASDRGELLRAGAEDCLTGAVNVSEIEQRLRLATARGGGHPAAARAPDAEADEGAARGGEATEGSDGSIPGEPLEPEGFADLLRARLGGEDPAVFTVVRLDTSGDRGELARELARAVRQENGDRVGRIGEGCMVFLPRTVPDEAEGFVRRIRSLLDGSGELDVEILGGVRDRRRLEDLLA